MQALLGLTETEIENALARAVMTYRGISSEAVPFILAEKRSVIRRSGALTYSHPEPVDHLGGYAHLRGLLEQAAVTFTPAARAYGVEPSKGVLLVGLPGCGKDLAKKIAAGVFGRPLLDLDMAAVMGEGGGVIGSAAVSIKRALSIATTLKAVLGLSEFEKGVGGLRSSARSDGGETARTIGLLLNWMAEQQDVYVFATANDVRQLAPEQLSQGRFSHLVFIDLPTPEDRAEIFRVHPAKRGRDPERFDLQQLAAAADFANWLWAETGTVFLDVDEEVDASIDWTRENVRELAEDWQHARAILDRIGHLATWLEADPPGRFAQLLDAILGPATQNGSSSAEHTRRFDSCDTPDATAGDLAPASPDESGSVPLSADRPG